MTSRSIAYSRNSESRGGRRYGAMQFDALWRDGIADLLFEQGAD